MTVPNLIQFKIPLGQLFKAQMAIGTLMAQHPGLIHTMEVFHDDDCAIFLGSKRHGLHSSVCNCCPDLFVESHEDNTTLGPVIKAWIADYKGQSPNT
jgi:hypothetical protein